MRGSVFLKFRRKPFSNDAGNSCTIFAGREIEVDHLKNSLENNTHINYVDPNHYFLDSLPRAFLALATLATLGYLAKRLFISTNKTADQTSEITKEKTKKD